MKHKLTSGVLAIALMLTMSVPAYAAEETCSGCPETAVLGLLMQWGGCNAQTDVQSTLNALLQQLFAQLQLPTQPAQPAETPETPSQPQEPEAPAQPETPTQPEKPEPPVETPSQPETPAAPSADSFMSAYEQEVVRLVNAERAKYGLAPLTADAQLTRTARMKSQDMHDRGYFDHNSPTYGSPFDLMKAQGVKYRTAGENIAMGYRTPEAVVSAWMNSSGHRANILNSSYTKIGVGYVASGSYWTQHFTG